MDHLVRNIKLLIAYDGTEFSGWQRQKQCRTIQGEIEACINRITQEKISLHGLISGLFFVRLLAIWVIVMKNLYYLNW